MKTVAIFATFLICAVMETRGGVTKCYRCHGRCMDPPLIEYCPQDEIYEYICWSSVTLVGTSIQTERRCTPNKPQTEASCEAVNSLPNSSCFLCDTDLCN